MLHPVIESLLFLKLARNSVCESIDNSSVEEKVELKDYIQNEASDYEVIHLVTLGEMPENKFDNEAEKIVWECFRKDMVKAYDYLTIEEGYNEEDVDRIIFEMGPVTELGLSSALPIMELHQHNGFFKEVIKESISDNMAAKKKSMMKKWKFNSAKRRVKGFVGAASTGDKIKTGAEDIAMKAGDKMKNMTQGQKTGAGAAALGAGAAYLAYKAYKKRKAEKEKKKK